MFCIVFIEVNKERFNIVELTIILVHNDYTMYQFNYETWTKLSHDPNFRHVFWHAHIPICYKVTWRLPGPRVAQGRRGSGAGS